MRTICRIRDIYRAIAQFEKQFQATYNLSMNEGMLLCSVSSKGVLTAGEIAEELGVTASNASKIITSVEKKGLIKRESGHSDKRRMNFSLTDEGLTMIEKIEVEQVNVPAMLCDMIKMGDQ